MATQVTQDAPNLVDEACQQSSITQDALLSSSSQRHLIEARAWIAHHAITLRIASLCEVARHFHRTEAGLRQSVKLQLSLTPKPANPRPGTELGETYDAATDQCEPS